ncbi:MAG TPA: hypothetical protein DGG95_07415, partial [Cytophagales bacterium]|nr:hypothetical protein [Cytophagales bacterium]
MKFFLAIYLSTSLLTFGQSTTKVPDSLFANQQWNVAIPLYEKAIKSGVTNALTWNRLGFCYHNVGQVDLAIKDYLISLNNKPSAFL